MAKSSGVQSIDRTFAIIELLAEHPTGLRLSDIVQETELHKSTAHRLLSALVFHDYVTQNDDSKKYKLTLKLYEIGSSTVDSMDILDVSRNYLEQLRDESQEAVHLVVRENSDIVYIYKAESQQSGIHMVSHVGMRRPMYCTAVGKAILATLNPSEVKYIWDNSEILPITPHTIVDYQKLLEELQQIRMRGYAMDNEENELGVRCIATSVPDYSGHSRAAFSVSAPLVRMSDDRVKELVPMLLQTRQKIAEGF